MAVNAQFYCAHCQAPAVRLTLTDALMTEVNCQMKHYLILRAAKAPGLGRDEALPCSFYPCLLFGRSQKTKHG